MSTQEDLGQGKAFCTALRVSCVLSFLGGVLLLGITFVGALTSGYWVAAFRDTDWGWEFVAISLVCNSLWGIFSVIASVVSALATCWFRRYHSLSFFWKAVAILPVLNVGFAVFLYFGGFLMVLLAMLAILALLPVLLLLFVVKL